MTGFRGIPSIAICGARGIGQVHARIFNELGSKVCAVLGSSSHSAAEVGRKLKDCFGIDAGTFSSLSELLDQVRPKALSICTPPQFHFDQIIAALDSNIAVFCEKPLFWDKDITFDQMQEKLVCIENHPNRRLFVNTSNAYFIDKLINRIASPEDIRSLSFSFYTHGKHLGRNIAVDLLPHGFSLLLRLLGSRPITSLTENFEQHAWHGCFNYGKCKVEFDFKEGPESSKTFAITIDQHRFQRVQQGQGATYRVFLQESTTGEKIEVEDPFNVYIKRFLNYCNNGALVGADDFSEAAANMRLMANILLEGSR